MGLANVPLSYQGLVVESTNRCNAKCDMCYQSSGPQGSDDWGISEMDVDTLKKAIRQAILLPQMQKRFHLAGGEAFIYFDNCIALFETAKETGYKIISATTNAFWAREPEKAVEKAQRLAKAGLNHIEISWDVWHLPYITPQSVGNCIIACSQAGISTNLRLLSTTKHTAGEALGFLPPECLDYVDEITNGPVCPSGRAEAKIPADEIFNTGNLGGNCHSFLNLTINAKGRVAPCCAGADQTEGMTFGDVHDDSIIDIASRMNASSMLRTLVFHGVGAMVPILEEQGRAVDADQCTSICHLCWKIFSNKENGQALTGYFDTLEKQAFEEAMGELNYAVS